MTELKIKQADINNNGNQRLMGDGGGEAPTVYHVCGCIMAAAVGCWRETQHTEAAVRFSGLIMK